MPIKRKIKRALGSYAQKNAKKLRDLKYNLQTIKKMSAQPDFRISVSKKGKKAVAVGAGVVAGAGAGAVTYKYAKSRKKKKANFRNTVDPGKYKPKRRKK